MSHLFEKALKSQNNDRPPVWLMRQAGRYLPEYASLRKKHSLWQMFHEPELALQTTHMPIQRFGMDAAILFSDILVIVEALGLQLAFPEGFGPIVTPLLQETKDIDALIVRPVEETLGYVKKTIELYCQDATVPLIGFCGGPFTVASYMIDRDSKNALHKTKTWMYKDPEGFHRLLQKITDASIAYLDMQIKAGVSAIQIFDSWAGQLSHSSFCEFSLRYLKQIVDAIQPRVPVILFCRGSSLFVKQLVSTRAGAISFDWQKDLHELRKEVPSHVAVQGNLDPHVLFASPQVVESEARKILDAMKGDPGFIFNLGHGVLPQTPVDNVHLLVDTIKSYQLAVGGREQSMASALPSD